MKPWEDRKTVTMFRRMRGERRLDIGFDLTESALEILICGIKDRNPHIRPESLYQEVEKSLW